MKLSQAGAGSHDVRNSNPLTWFLWTDFFSVGQVFIHVMEVNKDCRIHLRFVVDIVATNGRKMQSGGHL